jgi:hypothetical protein
VQLESVKKVAVESPESETVSAEVDGCDTFARETANGPEHVPAAALAGPVMASDGVAGGVVITAAPPAVPGPETLNFGEQAVKAHMPIR